MRQRYVFHDLQPRVASFRDDVVSGLSQPQKTLPPKYFYDERGSELFEAICQLPEYYLTRTEMDIMRRHAADMAATLGDGCALIEYGSGSGLKTHVLLAALRPSAYFAIDIAHEPLRRAAQTLAADFPALAVHAVCADYTQPLRVDALDGLDVARRVVYFSGSTIGNFTPREAREFLRKARELAGRGGAMLIGVDLKKARDVLEAAYDDAHGVTAAFNLNVLARINRELGGDFDLGAYVHRAIYDADCGRIEMHLVSRREQLASIDSHRFSFAAGESIHTENSYKYTIDEFRALARSAGFVPREVWSDSEARFSVHHLAVDA
jgi:dimethylhistidine N-methyltransferase